jgi:hypothetical protein
MTERSDDIVAEFPKNSRGEVIRVAVGNFKGVRLTNIRVWVRGNGDDAPMVPTKAGIAFRVELTPRLIAALQSIEVPPAGSEGAR